MFTNLITIQPFDFFYDLQFWICYFIIIVLFRIAVSVIPFRNIFFLICNIAMLMALPRFTIYSLCAMFLLIIMSYSVGKQLLNGGEGYSNRNRKITAGITVTIIVLALSFFKYSAIQNLLFNGTIKSRTGAADIIFIIGISYSSFKMIHFIVDSYNRKIVNLGFLNFLNYIFFFLSYISGPINRYNHFVKQIDSEVERKFTTDIKKGSERIIHGFFKKFVLCTILYPYTLVNIEGAASDLTGLQLLIGLYAHTLYFFFDFAGYTDIAIGSSRILGIELPENFNNPLVKKNIQQLWANWHMSLTTWLTDYIYWPLSKKLRKFNYFKKRPIVLSNTSIIVTFLVCGIWHGESIGFVIWGLYHGIGLATLNVYQKQKRKIRNINARKYFSSKASQFIGIFITFHFFTFGIIFFAFDLPTIITLFK